MKVLNYIRGSILREQSQRTAQSTRTMRVYLSALVIFAHVDAAPCAPKHRTEYSRTNYKSEE